MFIMPRRLRSDIGRRRRSTVQRAISRAKRADGQRKTNNDNSRIVNACSTIKRDIENILNYKNSIKTVTEDSMDFNPYKTLNIKCEDNDAEEYISNNKIVKACSPSSSVENILIDKNSIKTVTEDTTNLNSYVDFNIKDEDHSVEEYIKNNKEIDKMEIDGMINEMKAKLGNKDMKKERSTDKRNDDEVDIKVSCNLKENDPGLHNLEKVNFESNSNLNDSNNCYEIDVKVEMSNKPNKDNVIITQESLTNPDVNNSDVDNEDNDYYENDYKMVFDDNSESNGTDKTEVMLGNMNDSNWKYATATPVVREFMAMLLGVPWTNLDTISQDRYLHRCTMCSSVFDRPNKCKRHFIEHLLDDAYISVVQNKGLKCQICGEVLSNSSAYKSHMRFHASLPVYKCELCNKSSSDSSNFAKHKKVHKTSIHTCDLCQKMFQLKHQLVKHLEKHETTKSLVCTAEDCDRVFFRQNSYIRCRLVHLQRGMQYTCLVCKERFMTLKDKWDHQRANHMLEKPITCDVGQACSSHREPAMDDADKEVPQEKIWKNS